MKVKLELSNADITVLNKIKHLGLKDIDIADGTITLTTSLLKQRQLKQLLRNYEFKVTRQKSFLDVFAFFYARIALTCFLVISIAVFSVLYNFVFRIEVENEQVAQFLRQNGIRPMITKASVRNVDFAPMLINEFSFIAHASTQIRGTRLIFHIYQTQNPPKSPNEDLVARHNGVVEEIVVLSGAQMVFAGDSVTVGQIMVSANPSAVATIRGRIVASDFSIIQDKSQALMATLSLQNRIQNANPSVTFIYTEQFVRPLQDGTYSVEVTLSSGTMSLL